MKPPPGSTILRGAGSRQSVSQPSISIDQLLASLQRRGVPMPFEMGTFLVLEATERLIATMPVVVSAPDVWLSDDGELLVAAQGAASSEREACRALIILLGDLLVRSAPGVPAMLLQLVERGPSDGDWRLVRLRDDLEASLVPLNRGATRRVLARLLREAKRDAERSVAPPPDENAVDRELDEMLGIESSPAPEAPRISHPRPRAPAPPEPTIEPEPEPEPEPGQPQLPGRRRHADDVTLDVDIDPVSGRGVPRDRAAAQAPEAPEKKPRPDVPPAAAEPRPLLAADEEPRAPRRSRRESLDDFEHAAAGQGGSGMRIAQWLLVLTFALVAIYAIVGRERVRLLLGVAPEQMVQPVPTAPAPAAVPAAPRYGELRVTSTPPKAQVLMRVGEGPIVVPKLPVGVAHEFVAMLPGMSPSRAVVPPDAKWSQEGGEPRYELAIQLGAATARARENDLGPTKLTQDVGHPSATLGSVRVITSPPGASVYQLIGFTPDVSVQNMPLDQPIDLLVYLPGHLLQRVRVSAADWQKTAAGMLAEPAVTLTPEKR